MRIELTLDCTDLEVCGRFWQAALEYRADSVIEGRCVALLGDGPSLTLQRVPEGKRCRVITGDRGF